MKDKDNVLRQLDEADNMIMILHQAVERGMKIDPKKGRLVMFPPMWMFPHNGKPPISGPKYILSTYLHYK